MVAEGNHTSSQAGTAWAFHTNTGAAGTLAEAMRISADGDVGIGTYGSSITPNSNADNLVVEDDGDGGISILTPDANNSNIVFGSPTDASGALVRWNYDASLLKIGTTDSGANGELSFTTGNNAEAIRIYSDGDVKIEGSLGIGHTPSAKLDVYSSATRYVRVHQAGSLGDLQVVSDNGSMPALAVKGTGTADLVNVWDGSTEVFTILDGGRVTVKKSSNAEVSALTDATSITPDFDDANNFSVTLGSTIGSTRQLNNPDNIANAVGQSGVITITQDGSGSRLLTYNGAWKFEGGTAPTLTTTASAVDVLAYYVESSSRITAKLIKDTK